MADYAGKCGYDRALYLQATLPYPQQAATSYVVYGDGWASVMYAWVWEYTVNSVPHPQPQKYRNGCSLTLVSLLTALFLLSFLISFWWLIGAAKSG